MEADAAASAPPADTELVKAAADVGALLQSRGLSLATAESCTGGLLAHLVTQVPGSSAYFRGGVVVYANDLKERLLEVPDALLKTHGAVSAEVAAVMAEQACRELGADVAIATTGIAGPDGGSTHKPVGLVYLAAARNRNESVVERHEWPYDRDGNKRAAALAALRLVASVLATQHAG